MYARFALLSTVALMTAACSGTVIMSPMSPAQIASDYTKSIDTTGIIVFRAKPVVEVDRLTQITIPDPSKPGSTLVTEECTQTTTRKITTVADTEHPYRLHYDHGLLETYTFGATLTPDGVLTVINSQSTPDQGKTLQNLASAASSASGIAHAAFVPANKPPCTMTPTFAGFEDLPPAAEVKPFNSTK